MKKLLMSLLVVAALAGCSNSTAGDKSNGSTQKEEAPYYQLDEKEISNAIKGEDLDKITKENPVKIGQWVEVKRFDSDKNKFDTLYYRLNKVTKKSEDEKTINDAIEASNTNPANEGTEFNDKNWVYDKNSDLVLIDYEFYIPTNYQFATKEGEETSVVEPTLEVEGKDIKTMSFFGTEISNIVLSYKDYYSEEKAGYSYRKRLLFSVNNGGSDYSILVHADKDVDGHPDFGATTIYFAEK